MSSTTVSARPVGLNFVIRRYFRAIQAYRREFELTREQYRAYARLRAAMVRKCADFFADVSDLDIHKSVEIVHVTLGHSVETIPLFYVPQPQQQQSRKSA